jgi:predicted nucleic acid-binding protein
MILVDSSVWIAYFNGVANRHTDYLDALLGVEPVAIGDLMLTEVLCGFRTEAGYRTAKRLLAAVPVLEIAGRTRALRAVENCRYLRGQGIAVRRTTDTLIATFCIDERRPLLYTDKDFEPFVDYLGLRRAVA